MLELFADAQRVGQRGEWFETTICYEQKLDDVDDAELLRAIYVEEERTCARAHAKRLAEVKRRLHAHRAALVDDHPSDRAPRGATEERILRRVRELGRCSLYRAAWRSGANSIGALAAARRLEARGLVRLSKTLRGKREVWMIVAVP